MSADKLATDDDQPTAVYPSVATATPVPLQTNVSGERCSNCQSPMAADQRYCVVCGERRGRVRFAPAAFGGAMPPAADSHPVSVGSAGPPPARWNSSATIVAFIATLLVAVALGILIGHDSSGSGANAAQNSEIASLRAQIAGLKQSVNVTIKGGGGIGSGGSTNTASRKKPKVVKVAAKAPKVTAKQAAVNKQASVAESKALGGTGTKKIGAASTQLGGACTAGTAGCQNGKQTDSPSSLFPSG